MLATTLFFAGSYLTGKLLADETPPIVVVGMLSLTVTIGLAPLAAMVWVTPSLGDVMVLFTVACFATVGHYTMTRGFREAPITVTQPVTFLQLVWAVLLGYFVFGEALDGWVIFGGLVIITAVSFITWREAVVKRRSITPQVNATKV